jgi:gas vesicle structural protein
VSVQTQRHGGGGGGYVERAPGGGSSSLADVVALILDKGLVIDVFVRVSLVGIEILTIDARIVVASVDTYLRFAEACNRVDLEADSRSRTVPELFAGSGGGMVRKAGAQGAKKAVESGEKKSKKAASGAKKAVSHAKEKVKSALPGTD